MGQIELIPNNNGGLFTERCKFNDTCFTIGNVYLNSIVTLYSNSAHFWWLSLDIWLRPNECIILRYRHLHYNFRITIILSLMNVKLPNCLVGLFIYKQLLFKIIKYMYTYSSKLWIFPNIKRNYNFTAVLR